MAVTDRNDDRLKRQQTKMVITKGNRQKNCIDKPKCFEIKTATVKGVDSFVIDAAWTFCHNFYVIITPVNVLRAW